MAAPPGRRWAYCLLLILAGGAAYANSAAGVFIFDDKRAILDNTAIHRLDTGWLAAMRDRRPLVELSFALNYAVGGRDPVGYHVVNLVIHVLAGLTLFGIVRRTGRLRREYSFDDSPAFGSRTNEVDREGAGKFEIAATRFAFAVTLLWLVHPLQTQAVTYIVQRGESMMGLFYLLALYAYIRGSDSSEKTGDRSRWWLVVSVSACAAAMGCKGVAVTAPAIILIYDAVFLSGSMRAALRRRWRILAVLFCTWGVLWLVGEFQGVLVPRENSRATVGFGFKDVKPMEYLVSQLGVIVHYLRLSLWPHPLCLDHQWPVAKDVTDALPPGLAILLLVVATIFGLWRRRWWGFAGAWFFVILAPTSSVIPMKDLLFEHRMYLPLAGVIAVMVGIARGGVSRVARAFPTRNRIVRGGTAVALVVVALGLTGMTLRRNHDYCDAERMLTDIIHQKPDNARARVPLAQILLDAGRIDEAIAQYREMVRLEPGLTETYNNLANALAAAKQFDEAFERYDQALRIDSNYAKGHLNKGVLLAQLGRFDEAIVHFKRAVELEPQRAAWRNFLGLAYLRQRKFTEAMREYQHALSLEPGNLDARCSIGEIWMLAENHDQAEQAFREVLRLSPDYQRAKVGLANIDKARSSSSPGRGKRY